ncbi:MAG: hypothetical protein O6761_00320 [Thaumarchaeota archaeon]|nr:hypothetical protein [Nitrososphaerota archaeon]
MIEKKIRTQQHYIIKELLNFPLKNLERMFSIAVFERPIMLRHVKKMVGSMVDGEFYDNTLQVTKKMSGQYDVIDGQHRIEALGLLRDDYGVTHYDLILHVYPESLARRIYRKLNLGRTLTLGNHLRALDNGKNSFFVRLRHQYVHYNKGKVPKFEQILNALHYAKNGSPRAVNAILLDRMFKSITTGDIDVILVFSKAIHKNESKINTKLYKYGIYRNLFRVGYENNFNLTTWQDFISICNKNRVIHAYQTETTFQNMKRIYNYMVDSVGKEMGLELKKIERTPSQTKLVLDGDSNHAPITHYD